MKTIVLLALCAFSVFGQQIDFVRQVGNKPFADVREFNWYRTNGSGADGDLSSPGSATVTLTKCPKGLAGDNVGHYMRISGGTGTAEQVLITGGSCTSGAASGTVTFGFSNSHTGAWRIASATAGAQEAAYTLTAGGGVYFPAGSYQIYAAISFPRSGIQFFGEGTKSVLVPQSDGMSVLKVWNQHYDTSGFDGFAVRNLKIDAAAITGLNTVKGIEIGSSVESPTTNTRTYNVSVTDMSFDNTSYAIWCDRCTTSTFANLTLNDNARIWVGSTVTTQYGATGSNIFRDITHAWSPVNFLDPDIGFILTIQRGIVNLVDNFKCVDLLGVGKGIELRHGEGNMLLNVSLGVPAVGIKLSQVTIEEEENAPRWTTIHNLTIDRWTEHGVITEPTAYFTRISHAMLTGTGQATPEQEAAVLFGGDSARGSSVSNSTIQNLAIGYGVLVAAPNVDWRVSNNNFVDVVNPAVGVLIQSGSQSGYAVTGNNFPSGLTQKIADQVAASNAKRDGNINYREPVKLESFTLSELTGGVAGAMNGLIMYCSDCEKGTNPCATSGGTSIGVVAKREGSAWRCN